MIPEPDVVIYFVAEMGIKTGVYSVKDVERFDANERGGDDMLADQPRMDVTVIPIDYRQPISPAALGLDNLQWRASCPAHSQPQRPPSWNVRPRFALASAHYRKALVNHSTADLHLYSILHAKLLPPCTTPSTRFPMTLPGNSTPFR